MRDWNFIWKTTWLKELKRSFKGRKRRRRKEDS